MKPKFIFLSFLLCQLALLSFGGLRDADENSRPKNQIEKERDKISIFTTEGIEFIIKHAEKEYTPNKVSFFDIWHLWEAYEHSDGERKQKIVQAGEWETAIKTDAGFVGGALHGFERKKSIQFFLDGKAIDEGMEIPRSSFMTFKMVQVSDLYAYNSVDEKIAEVTKRWYVSKGNEIKLEQEVHWLKKLPLETAYLGMFPVMREDKGKFISTKATRNDVDGVIDVSESGEVPAIGSEDKSSSSNSMQLWGDRYLFELKVKREHRLPNSSIWLWAPKQYNKIYFDYCGSYEVKPGEVFRVTSSYSITKKNPPREDKARIVLNNDHLSLGFDVHNGGLILMEDLKKNKLISNSEHSANQSPWELSLDSANKTRNLDISDFKEFNYNKPDPNTLELIWSGAVGMTEDLKVKATVRLKEDASLSSWNIVVEGLEGMILSKVVFPKISGLESFDDGYLAVPRWMGELLHHPKAYLSSLKKGGQRVSWSYPGHLSMQFLTLYNEERAFYAATDDGEIYGKNFAIELDSLNTMVYELESFPDVDESRDVYSRSYNAIVGFLYGDWLSAAKLYGEWGVNQSWAKDSRLKNGLTPEWLQNTALWVWNRGRSEGVLEPAEELKERLGLPISVLWHWWHGGSYDDSFPEYLPPRDGEKVFIENVKRAQENGVRALVYMNQLQWGPSTASWKRENAARYTVKDKEGDMNTHVYNIFTKKALTNMCIATEYWRDKYASIADSAINYYGVDGIYMDQACISRRCYDASHGHPLGGGNYWVPKSGKLTGQIREGVLNNKEIALSGEGSGEAWMPYLDVFLALQVSRERYGGVGAWEPIPLFQAVYHEYAISYGNYSSLLSPPYDEMWPDGHRPKEALQLLDTMFNKQFLMEQARSYVWGMQPMISNYKPSLASERKEEMDYLLNLARLRNKNLKYLLHGRYVRSPEMMVPEENLKISRLSIYAGQNGNVTTFEKVYPMVYYSSWMAEDGMLGIAIASIHDRVYPIDLSFDVKDYGLSDSGRVYMVTASGKKLLSSYTKGIVNVKYQLDPREIGMIEVIPD